MTNKGNDDIIKVIKLVGFLFLYSAMFAYVFPLNPETLIHNWGIGIIGIIVFATLYLIKIEKILFKPKKLYFFMISISICFILGDWADLILFMRGS